MCDIDVFVKFSRFAKIFRRSREVTKISDIIQCIADAAGASDIVEID